LHPLDNDGGESDDPHLPLWRNGVSNLGNVVNLRLARKARGRSEAEAQAAANRARHGQSKGERLKDSQERARQERQVDGAKRERQGDLPE
jgi:hypothetical protein